MQINHLFKVNFGFHLNDSVNILLKKETMMVFNLLFSKLQGIVSVNFTVKKFGKAFDFAEIIGNFAFQAEHHIHVLGNPEASLAKTSQSYSL